MKYLGIDYGKKRTGIALSDPEGRIAFPHAVIETRATLSGDIIALMEKEHCAAIVLGASVDREGKDNPVMSNIRALASELEGKGVQVFFEPEQYTSALAARVQGEHALHDASAAALILQSFLDKKKPHTPPADPYALPNNEEI